MNNLITQVKVHRKLLRDVIEAAKTEPLDLDYGHWLMENLVSWISSTEEMLGELNQFIGELTE